MSGERQKAALMPPIFLISKLVIVIEAKGLSANHIYCFFFQTLQSLCRPVGQLGEALRFISNNLYHLESLSLPITPHL